jgi:hypothetical protein
MNEITTTITGNLTADPELRYTPTGVAVANFSVASTPAVTTAPPVSGGTASRSTCGAPSGARPPRTSPSRCAAVTA